MSLQAVIKEKWYEGELQSVFQLWGEYYPCIQEPRNTTKSATQHTSQQEVGKEEPRRVAVSAMARNSRNWAEGRAYIGFLRNGVEWSFPRWALMAFQVQSLGFLLCRAGVGPNFRIVRVFYGWNLASWRSWGRGLATCEAWGAYVSPFWLLLIDRLWEREMMLSLDYFLLNLHCWYNWESLTSGFLAR